jgi:hypothetical protein
MLGTRPSSVHALAMRILSCDDAEPAGADAPPPPPLGLAQLSHLSHLRELCVELVQPNRGFSGGMRGWQRLSGADFADLGRLPAELRRLRFLVGECRLSPDVTSVHWVALATRLPHLEVLYVDAKCDFNCSDGGVVLREIGSRLRFVCELRLPHVPFELLALEGGQAKTCCFRCLGSSMSMPLVDTNPQGMSGGEVFWLFLPSCSTTPVFPHSRHAPARCHLSAQLAPLAPPPHPPKTHVLLDAWPVPLAAATLSSFITIQGALLPKLIRQGKKIQLRP